MVYSLNITPELRIAIDTQAALEPGTSSADVARRWLEMGRLVQEAGCATLDEFCTAQRNETLDNWTDNDAD